MAETAGIEAIRKAGSQKPYKGNFSTATDGRRTENILENKRNIGLVSVPAAWRCGGSLSGMAEKGSDQAAKKASGSMSEPGISTDGRTIVTIDGSRTYAAENLGAYS